MLDGAHAIAVVFLLYLASARRERGSRGGGRCAERCVLSLCLSGLGPRRGMSLMSFCLRAASVRAASRRESDDGKTESESKHTSRAPRPSSLLRAGPAAFSTRYAVRVGSRRLTHTLSEPRLARLGFVAARSPPSPSSLTTASRQRSQAVLRRASMQAQASHHAPLEALVAIQARLKPPRPPAPDSAAPPRSALDTATASLHGWLGDLAALVRPISPCSPTSPHRHRVTSSSSAGRPSLRGALEPPQVHALTLARYRTASLPTPRATSPRSCARST